MENLGYLTQLLYLLVYSSALINTALIIVFRKKMNTNIDGFLRQMLLSIAFCSTIFSIQVFLNAVGLLERLQEDQTYRIVLILNTLIIIGIALLVRSAVMLSFSLRPGSAGIKIQKAASGLIAIIIIFTGFLQIRALFSHSIAASELLGILMLIGMALFSAGIIFSMVRLYIPMTLANDPALIAPSRNLLLLLCLFPLIFLISGSFIGTILAPAGILLLNIFSLRIGYYRLKETITSADSGETHSTGSAFDPLSACHEIGLSKRESEVAMLLAEGRTYKEVAAELFISMSTTQTHVGRIYSKLGINSKIELSNLIYYKKNK